MLPGRITRVGWVFGTNPQERIKNFEKNITGSLNSKLQITGSAIYGYSPVEIGNQTYKVGDIIQNEGGQKGRINPDGSVTILQ